MLEAKFGDEPLMDDPWVDATLANKYNSTRCYDVERC